GTTTEYTYASGLLVSQSDPTTTLNFTYSADGIPRTVTYGQAQYYYLYNLQGDVMAIYDSQGSPCVKYKYDTWGKLLSVTGTMASTLGAKNPFRYRGYVYDTETGYYYLTTRYYDPETGRFLNADGYVSTGETLTGYNMFAYCCDNPVRYKDDTGNRRTDAINSQLEGKDSDDVRHKYLQEQTQVQTNYLVPIVDITDKLNNAMLTNAEILSNYKNQNNYIDAVIFFVNKVKPGGDWDFKSQDDWALTSSVKYKYHGETLRFDDIGNIHYGYVGRVLFSDDVLLLAGGLVQISTRTSDWSYWNTNFDDPRDQWAVAFGCQIWDTGVVK
ncbi:MAG: hypothetical protein IJN59_05010, partial [Oscillospiraceae bacterium]|nr:hypothetical protein [Oscillospiraceae bacterium]